MTVVSADEYRRPVGQFVDERARRQPRRRPALIVPVAAENPLAGPRSRTLADTPRELAGGFSVAQVDVLELRTTVDEMHVRVVEAGNDAPPSGINDHRVRAAPSLHVAGGADVDDPLPDDCERARVATRGIAGPDFRVRDHEIRGNLRATGA